MIDVPVEVKETLQDGRRKKNYRFNVLNDDGTVDFTIDNNTLVSESVNIDERMCSGDTLKFGLCEGSSLEFQYFGHPNIKGRRIQVFIDVHTRESVHTIPMGFFTAKKCSRQASTGIIKVTAYNKLQSDYLDQKANQLLLDGIDNQEAAIPIYSIEKALLKNYEITPYTYQEQQSFGGLASNDTMIVQKVHLSDLTSDGGPINYHDLVNPAAAMGVTLTTSTDLYVIITSTGDVWPVGPVPLGDSEYYQFEQDTHDIGDLIENFAQYLKDFFDACPLSKTGSEIIDGIKNQTMGLQGWRGLFGIYLRHVGFSGSLTYYNDYAYKYQNNGSYNVDGTVDDLTYELIRMLSAGVEDYLEATLYFPLSMQVCILRNGTYEPLDSYLLIGENEIHYIGAGHTAKQYPQFKYADGSIIPMSTQPFEDWFKFYKIEGLTDADLITMVPSTAPDFTLRDILSADYETQCLFGQLDRTTDLFSGVELNHQRLYPAEDLYPENTLYPGGAAMSSHRSTYSKLWGDEGNIQKWRYLIITYKGLDEEQKEKDFTLQRTVNADGNVDYNMSDNWLFRNLVWNSYEVEQFADAMKEKMRDVTWFPFEMWGPGLPYLETGDEIEVSINNSTYPTYILQRQLKGIQNLQDTYINGTLDIF